MKDTDDSNYKIVNTLRVTGIKCTPSALEILEVLWAMHEPMDIPQIQEQLKVKTHIATTYRILEKLADAKVLNKLKFNEQKSFYEMNILPHNHFVCSKCHKVIDIYIDNQELKSIKNQVEKDYGINVETASINFSGLCSNCKVH